MNKIDEARKVMEEALPMGSMLEVHFYGRNLLSQKQSQEALKVFKLNYDKNPNVFTTNMGMGRVYSSLGEYKKAINYLKAALPQAPNDFNKSTVEGMIKKLEEGKDIN